MMAESTASNRQSNDDDDDYMADLSRFLPSDDAIVHPSISTKSSSKRVTFIYNLSFKLEIRFPFSFIFAFTFSCVESVVEIRC